MSYAKINVYGSDACSVRIRAALVLAIQAAVDGKRVLLTEIGSNNLGMLLPSKLVFDGEAELFSITGIEDSRLLIAVTRKPGLSEEDLAKFVADRELMVCACNGVSKKDKKSKANKVLAGGYDGIMLQDAASLSNKLSKAFVVAAVPDPLPKHFSKIKELAQAKVAAFGNDTYEMPLINYTTITLPEEQENDGLWQTCKQLLGKMDFSKQFEAPTTPDQDLADQAVASDGSDQVPIAEKLPAPDADLAAQTMSGNVAPAEVVAETTAKYEQRFAGHVDEFKASRAASDQQHEQEIEQTQSEWQTVEENHGAMAQVRKENLETRKAVLDEEAQATKDASAAIEEQAQDLAKQQEQEELLRKQRIDEAAKEREKFKEDFANEQSAKAKQKEEEERKEEERKLAKQKEEEQRKLEEQKSNEQKELEKQKASQEAKLLARQKKKKKKQKRQPITASATGTAQFAKPALSTAAAPSKQDVAAQAETTAIPPDAADKPVQSEPEPSETAASTDEKQDVAQAETAASPPDAADKPAQGEPEASEAAASTDEKQDVAQAETAASPPDTADKPAQGESEPSEAAASTDEKHDVAQAETAASPPDTAGKPAQGEPEASEAAASTDEKQAEAEKDKAEPAKEESKAAEAEPSKKDEEEAPVSTAEQEQGASAPASPSVPPNKRLLEAAWATENLEVTPTEHTKQAFDALKAIGGKDAASGKQAPDKEGGKQAPDKDGGKQAPDKDGGKQAPDKDGGKQAPDKDDAKRKPGKASAKKKIEAFVPQAQSFSLPVLINTDAMSAHVKFKDAAKLLAEENFSEKHPDYPPIPKEEDAKGKQVHEQFQDIFRWYQALPKSKRSGIAQRQAALILFKFASEARESGHFNMYKIASDFAINALSGYEDPDFDFLILWYRHAVWLAHLHINDKDHKAANESILSLLNALSSSKKAFLAQPDISDADSVFSMFLVGLILVAVRIEEIDQHRVNDKSVNALRSHADALLGKLDDKHKASLTEGIDAAKTEKDKNDDTDKPDQGSDNDPEKKKIADEVAAARDAFGDM